MANYLQRLSFFTNTLGQLSTSSQLAITCSGSVCRLAQTYRQRIETRFLRRFLYRALAHIAAEKFSG
ncbi:hypothetical protein [Paraburkholderia sp. GAS334]|uniref:hypothetical protein n=1 Tax=Paraburkholderia sp. GAS334 TaxID=3035131 RepID=UPI003D1FF216